MLCFPSFFGPDNIPPLEAMALGVPVAAADVLGARNQLQDAALFFNPSCPQSIAEAILNLHQDSSLRSRLITAGYSLVSNRTPDHYVKRMLIAFQQIKPRVKASQRQL
jgi:glycosyltransferase involved in cell wall biosynthesis